MKIFSSPYELVAKADGRRRSGSLIRVEFDDGLVGYADIHPWTQFGDEVLTNQLQSLVAGARQNVAKHSLEFARQDAVARAEDRWLFDGLVIPSSHKSLPFGFSYSDLKTAAEEGFSIIKLKMSTSEDKAFGTLPELGLKVRLDFNGRLTLDLRKRLSEWDFVGWLDWIEDPGPYDEGVWRGFRRDFGVRVAIDFEQTGHEEEYDIFVLKPARTSLVDFHEPKKTLSVTSYLDHPIGQMFAAWTAAVAVSQGLPVETCGLITHTVYEENLFSRAIRTDGPKLLPPEGTGIGFDEELASLEWDLVQ